MGPSTIVLWDIDHTLIDNAGVSKEIYAAAFDWAARWLTALSRLVVPICLLVALLGTIYLYCDAALAGQAVTIAVHHQLPGRHHARQGHPGGARTDPEQLARAHQDPGRQPGRVDAEQRAGHHRSSGEGSPRLGPALTLLCHVFIERNMNP